MPKQQSIYSVAGGSSLKANSFAEKIIEKLPSSFNPGVTFHLTSHFALKVALEAILTGGKIEQDEQNMENHLLSLSLNGILVNMKYSF